MERNDPKNYHRPMKSTLIAALGAIATTLPFRQKYVINISPRSGWTKKRINIPKAEVVTEWNVLPILMSNFAK